MKGLNFFTRVKINDGIPLAAVEVKGRIEKIDGIDVGYYNSVKYTGKRMWYAVELETGYSIAKGTDFEKLKKQIHEIDMHDVRGLVGKYKRQENWKDLYDLPMYDEQSYINMMDFKRFVNRNHHGRINE